MSEGAIEVSVVVCTRNRSARLRATLDSLSAQASDGIRWEVVVVDNGSDDGTADVVADFESDLPIRCVPEPELGLSHARNRGVHEARGGTIVWIDDDVILSAGWLSAWVDGIRAYPDAAFFGGGIEVHFEAAPPPWIDAGWRWFGSLFAERHVPEPGARVQADYLPFGANYAVRTAAQRRVPYDPALGRRGGQVAGGEETTLLADLLDRGLEGRWVAGSELHHVIGPERVTLERLHTQIRENARLLADPPRGSSGDPLSAAQIRRRWIRSAVVHGIRRRTSGPERWVNSFVEAAVWRGHLDRVEAAGRGQDV
ncbi:MAG: glycosyltransferase [Gemmatimonadota bacterium]